MRLGNRTADWLGSDTASISKEAVVLVPGCSPAKPSKRWPAAHFAAVARPDGDWTRDVAIVGTAAIAMPPIWSSPRRWVAPTWWARPIWSCTDRLVRQRACRDGNDTATGVPRRQDRRADADGDGTGYRPGHVAPTGAKIGLGQAGQDRGCDAAGRCSTRCATWPVQKDEPGVFRNSSSSSLEGRPRMALRCGNLPNRAMMSRCLTAYS